MPNNAPHNALRGAVADAIANGAPVYVEMRAQTVTLPDLKAEYRFHADSSDPWGGNMQWLFAIAEESYFNRDGRVADMLEYSPGAAREPDPDNVGSDLLEYAPDSVLEQFATILQRVDSICRARNLDY